VRGWKVCRRIRPRWESRLRKGAVRVGRALLLEVRTEWQGFCKKDKKYPEKSAVMTCLAVARIEKVTHSIKLNAGWD